MGITKSQPPLSRLHTQCSIAESSQLVIAVISVSEYCLCLLSWCSTYLVVYCNLLRMYTHYRDVALLNLWLLLSHRQTLAWQEQSQLWDPRSEAQLAPTMAPRTKATLSMDLLHIVPSQCPTSVSVGNTAKPARKTRAGTI